MKLSDTVSMLQTVIKTEAILYMLNYKVEKTKPKVKVDVTHAIPV